MGSANGEKGTVNGCESFEPGVGVRRTWDPKKPDRVGGLIMLWPAEARLSGRALVALQTHTTALTSAGFLNTKNSWLKKAFHVSLLLGDKRWRSPARRAQITPESIGGCSRDPYASAQDGHSTRGGTIHRLRAGVWSRFSGVALGCPVANRQRHDGISNSSLSARSKTPWAWLLDRAIRAHEK